MASTKAIFARVQSCSKPCIRVFRLHVTAWGGAEGEIDCPGEEKFILAPNAIIIN